MKKFLAPSSTVDEMSAPHPFLRNDYLILTRPIERVIKSLVRWLQLNVPGAIVFGQRRLGKSHCAEFIRKYLSDLLGYKIAVVLMCVRFHDSYRENDFLDEMMAVLGDPAPARSGKERRLKAIVNRLLVLARRCPYKKVILVLDDAQRLQQMHFEVLMTLQNELYMQYRVMLFTLMVGQPQLKTKRDLLIASGEKQITARMMADEIEFVGQRSLEEVQFALNRIDKHCFYPARSGVTFTQGLAPEAWAANWRLGNEAEAVWTAYTSRREEMKLSPAEEISMEALTKMASYIFQNYANRPEFTGLTSEQATDVVDSAGMLQLEALGHGGDADGSDD